MPGPRARRSALPPAPRRSRPLASGHLAKLGKHSGVLLVGNLLSRGVGMLLIPVYTGVLAREVFSYWEALLAGAGLIGMLASGSISAALMWTLKTGGRVGDGELTGEQRDRAIATAIGWAMVTGTVLCGGAMLLAETLSEGLLKREGYGTALALLLGSQALRVVCYPAEGVLKLRFQSLPIMFMSFGEFLVQLLGTILALVVFQAGLTGMAWASFAAAGLRFALGLVYLPEMRKPRLEWVLVGGFVAYSLPLVSGSVASFLLSLSDRVFFNRLDMADVGGLYAYGDKWARIVEFLLVTPLMGMWPAVYFNIARDSDARQQLGRMGTLWVGLGGTLALVLTMVGPVLTDLFDTSANREYAGASAAIGVLSAGYVLLGLLEVARAGFAITARTRRTAVAMILAAGLNLLLNGLLIPRFGAVGAGWATLLAYASSVGLCILLSRSFYPLSWQWKRLAHAGVVLVGFAWLAGSLFPAGSLMGQWTWLLGVVQPELSTGQFLELRLAAASGGLPRIIAAALAPTLLLATGFLTRDELGQLASLVRSRLPARWR